MNKTKTLSILTYALMEASKINGVNLTYQNAYNRVSRNQSLLDSFTHESSKPVQIRGRRDFKQKVNNFFDENDWFPETDSDLFVDVDFEQNKPRNSLLQQHDKPPVAETSSGFAGIPTEELVSIPRRVLLEIANHLKETE